MLNVYFLESQLEFFPVLAKCKITPLVSILKLIIKTKICTAKNKIDINLEKYVLLFHFPKSFIFNFFITSLYLVILTFNFIIHFLFKVEV